MYETASTGSPAVPVVTGQTTDPTALSNALTAYNQKYLNNVLGVNSANGQPASTGQQSLQPLLAATGTYTLLDNHELGNQALQSGGAPPAAPFRTTNPSFDVNNTGAYDNKTAGFPDDREILSRLSSHSCVDSRDPGDRLYAERSASDCPLRSPQQWHPAIVFRAAMGRQQRLHPDRRPKLS